MGKPNIDYETYYKEQLNDGLEFQDFVVTKFSKELGITITNYSSKKYQFDVGENIQGIEIKYDKKFRTTGNLYIETAEKSDPTNRNYVASGIYRTDNSWIYAIGDYECILLFSKKQLRLLNESRKYKSVITPTSKGMLLPVRDAESYIIKKMEV